MKRGWRVLETAAPLLLAALFAAAAALVLAAGAGAYRSASAGAQTAYSFQTGLDYVAARVRAYDDGGVSVEEREGTPVLRLCGDGYQTLVYCLDGSLCELLSEPDAVLPLDAGERLLPLDALSFSLDGDVLSVTCELDGERAGRTLCLRAGGAA